MINQLTQHLKGQACSPNGIENKEKTIISRWEILSSCVMGASHGEGHRRVLGGLCQVFYSKALLSCFATNDLHCSRLSTRGRSEHLFKERRRLDHPHTRKKHLMHNEFRFLLSKTCPWAFLFFFFCRMERAGVSQGGFKVDSSLSPLVHPTTTKH